MKLSAARAIEEDLAACGEVVSRFDRPAPHSEIEEDADDWSVPSEEVVEMLENALINVRAELVRVRTARAEQRDGHLVLTQ